MKQIYYEAGSKELAKTITDGSLVFVNENGQKSLRANGLDYDFGPKYWYGTKEEYNQITEKDPNTLYMIYK